MFSVWEFAGLVIAAWFLVRVTRGRQCSRKRGFARVVLVVGAVVLVWMLISGNRHDQREAVAFREAPSRAGSQRTVHFGQQSAQDSFARIDADELKQYRAQVSRRARLSAASEDKSDAGDAKPCINGAIARITPYASEDKSDVGDAKPVAPVNEAESSPVAAPLPAENPEAPAVAAPRATPAAPAPPAPAATPSPTKSAKTVRVQFQAGPLRVEMDTDEESGLPSSEDITRAATSVAAQATVEGVKYLTRASADAARKTAARFTSTSKKTGEKAAKIVAVAAASGPEARAAIASRVTAEAPTDSAPSVPAATPPAATGIATAAAPRAGRPAWVDEPLGKRGAVYRTKVVVGPYKTRQECEQEQIREVLQAARSVINRQIGSSNQISDRSLQPYLFSSRILKEEWEEHKESETANVGEMIWLHALLEFDDRSWRELARMQQQRDIEARLTIAGLGAGWLLALLGTVFGYLKLDTLTRGYYTRRLQLAAGAVILTLIGAAVLSLGVG